MRGLSLSAVLVGLAVGAGASWVFGLGTSLVFSVLLGVSTAPPAAAAEALSRSDAFHWGTLLASFLATFLAGYTAGRIAGARPVEHGVLVGVASIFVGLYLTARFGEPTLIVPQWALILGLCFTPVAGAAGGFAASDSPGAFV